ncbi:hypothetical protein SAMN04487949_0376 [Halogranum gelatinilyticum]|uniref:Uncharacterized protein n=1 Tax=Halogranum gelatinilyticum TaxID=660521 RepID=A0A1G9PI06_9EURY|nr:hypothetical protein [Halogranum gelatinilyticum]SDL97827.1 hypothetical protein SAMN04487949_0376 [Halogranum gelatinilyticum]
MTESAHGQPVPLDLTLEERWVAHAAVLRALEGAEGGSDWCDVSLLETVERSDEFMPAELRALRTALTRYLVDAPPRDREVVESLLDTLDAALA